MNANTKDSDTIKPFLWLSGIVVTAWLTYWVICVASINGHTSDQEKQAVAERGQFGDMFGGLNALFSALAFAALVYSMWLQRVELRYQRTALEKQMEELELQREELTLTREELKRSADVQTQTEQTYRRTLAVQTIVSHVESLIRIIGWRVTYLNSANPLQGSWDATSVKELCAWRDSRRNHDPYKHDTLLSDPIYKAVDSLITLKVKVEELYITLSEFSWEQENFLNKCHSDKLEEHGLRGKKDCRPSNPPTPVGLVE